MDNETAEKENGFGRRQYIHVLFDCCNVYQRIYKRRGRNAYIGWCSVCGRRVRVKIGPNGTACRFFRAK